MLIGLVGTGVVCKSLNFLSFKDSNNSNPLFFVFIMDIPRSRQSVLLSSESSLLVQLPLSEKMPFHFEALLYLSFVCVTDEEQK